MNNSSKIWIGLAIAVVIIVIGYLFIVKGSTTVKFGSSTVYAENYDGYIRQNQGWYTQYPVGTESTLSVTGAATFASTVVANKATGTSTLAIGGTTNGKLCLWNGTNFTVLSYAANTTTLTTATSTTCQ